MSKFTLWKWTICCLCTKRTRQARQVISQELQRVDKIREKVASLLSERWDSNAKFYGKCIGRKPKYTF